MKRSENPPNVDELLKSLTNLSPQDFDESGEDGGELLDQTQDLENEIQAFLKDHPVNTTGGGGGSTDSNAKEVFQQWPTPCTTHITIPIVATIYHT
jgi:hypothetical protein